MQIPKSVLLFVLSLLVVSLTTACAKPPADEIDEMNATFATLETADAASKVPAEWEKVGAAVTAVNEELRSQEAKFALFRSFVKTKELLRGALDVMKKAQDVMNRPVPTRNSRGRRSEFALDSSGLELTCQCVCTPRE